MRLTAPAPMMMQTENTALMMKVMRTVTFKLPHIPEQSDIHNPYFLVEENTLCDRKFTRPPPTMSSTIVGSLTHQAQMATPQMERRRWRVPITRLPVLKLQQIGKGMTIKISLNIREAFKNVLADFVR